MEEGVLPEEERTAIDQELTQLHAEAKELVARAEAMEKEGQLEEAKILYESVAAFAADFPGIQEQIKQTEEALALIKAIKRRSNRSRQTAEEVPKKTWWEYWKTLLASSKTHPRTKAISKGNQRIYQAAVEVSKKLWPNHSKQLLGIGVLGGIVAVSLALFFTLPDDPQKKQPLATASLQPAPAPAQVSSTVSPQSQRTPNEVQVPAAPPQDQPAVPVTISETETSEPQAQPTRATQPEHTTNAAPEQISLPEQPQLDPTATVALVPTAPPQDQPVTPVTTGRTETSALQADAIQAGQPEDPTLQAISHEPPDLPRKATHAANIKQTYIVQAGDSLSRIAERRFCNMEAWKTIFKINQEHISNPNELHPGMVLDLHGLENRCPPKQ
jgi:nucleoid-associated protein YgaU